MCIRDRGLATEGARALVHHAFTTLGLFRIIGVTNPDNRASQRVLMKCGLHDRGWARYYDRRVRLFAADRPRSDGRRTDATYPASPAIAFPQVLRERSKATATRTGG